VSEWQPIETAPKDGTYLLLINVRDFERGQMLPFVGVYTHLGIGKAWSKWIAVPGCYGQKPTHWMPLPAPPANVSPTSRPTETNTK